MQSRQNKRENGMPEIKGGQKVIKTSPELAGLDDRTTLDSNRNGNDLQGGALDK